MTDSFDREALLDALTNTHESYASDPGHAEWLEALVAWMVDEGEHLDAAQLAYNLALTSSVGAHIESELPGFAVRAIDTPTFGYYDARGELQAGTVNTHRLSTLSDDPRELACAIAAVVRAEAMNGENVVLFRKLVFKTGIPRLRTTHGELRIHPYSTRFGLAKID